MTLNKDLFLRDPLSHKIPNDGVATVGTPETEEQWDVLRWELDSFVCEGEYERGMETILDTFLKNLGQKRQPAVWVSGFYGSGKSHLCRVLEYLWRDVTFPDGESARSLADLPLDIVAHLKELSNAGKRHGGLWSAAGTLAAGRAQSVRLAFLSIMFEAAGLPGQYPLARFILWAEQNGYADAVKQAVADAGKELDQELSALYVSPIIASALLQADSSLGDSVKDVRELLKLQFPPKADDITDDEMFDAIEQLLERQSDRDGQYPLTLVVLDEMQQYLGDDNAKTLAVQNIVEGITARFDNSILMVATGQAEMVADPTLEKLNDRFTVKVHLSDRDVETVVRKVILQKRPDKVPQLGDRLEDLRGEIDRHLGGTKLQATSSDRADLVPDYPVLPTRRRFWEVALKALDRGRAGVLRTQLRVTHEAARLVADQEVGHVVGADFIYDQQSAALQQSGVLLKEIDELIRSLKGQGADGLLMARICAVTFLIDKIPTNRLDLGAIGLRPTASTIADLLVDDLADGATVRKQVPDLLDRLVTGGQLMRIDDEYRLQTEEGADWEKDYQSRRKAILDDPARLARLRGERLIAAVDKELGGLKLTQGKSKAVRRIDQSWGDELPEADGDTVPVWLRDGWSVTDSAVRSAAAAAGDDDPVVHVLLRKREADTIKDALASHAAASDVLNTKATPQTDEGREAQQAMRGRQASDDDRLTRLFATVATEAIVMQGGGNEVDGATLRDRVETAAERSLVRLFEQFHVADHPGWGKVTSAARDGAPDALTHVGHGGDVPAHPVCRELLASISAGGTDGNGIVKRFERAPYGWPTDAVRGGIMALLAGRHIRAQVNGADVNSPKELEPRQVGKATYFKESPPPTVRERLAVGSLLAEAGIQVQKGSEDEQLPALLQKLIDLAEDAGGAAPLPERPSTDHIVELRDRAGNDRFKAVAAAHGQLKDDLTNWKAAAQKREARQKEWRELDRLLVQSRGLDLAADVQGQYDAVRDGRQLLDDPDPVKPLLDNLTDQLRAELLDRVRRLSDAAEQANAELAQEANWQQLDEQARERILRAAKLQPVDQPDVSTDEKLLAAIERTPLASWDERINFVGARLDQARQAAAKELEPESVSVRLPSATIRTQADLDAYLEQVKSAVASKLDDGATVIV